MSEVRDRKVTTLFVMHVSRLRQLMWFVGLSSFLSLCLSFSLCLSLCVYFISLLKRLLSHTPRTCMGLSSLIQTRKVSISPLERSVETFAPSCKAIIQISLRKYPTSLQRRPVAFMKLKGVGWKTFGLCTGTHTYTLTHRSPTYTAR